MSTIPCSSKTRYPSKFAAEQAADLYFRQHGWKSRGYPCPFTSRTRHWHLTTLTMPEYLKPLHDAAVRRVAEQQAREIIQEENAYLRRRLAEITAELTAYWEHEIAQAFLESLDRRRQREILKELGYDTR